MNIIQVFASAMLIKIPPAKSSDLAKIRVERKGQPFPAVRRPQGIMWKVVQAQEGVRAVIYSHELAPTLIQGIHDSTQGRRGH